jgi:hypothetical protein
MPPGPAESACSEKPCPMAAAVVVVDPSRASGHGHEMVAFRGFGVSAGGDAVCRVQASGYRE